jgi:mRNA interferase RelE/StbE
VYRVRILDVASRELGRLDRLAARRIAERITWLAANLGTIKPEPLGRDLSGLYKLRVGDYRVLYEILHDERTIVIHSAAHRRDVYRKR